MEIKRNNPGNIRKVEGTTWYGEVPGTTAPNFITFDTLTNGFRAMIKLLNIYTINGYNTIEKIINRWAPPSDNNPTDAYIQFVADKTKLDPKAPIETNDYNTLGNVAMAMTFMEHGVKSDDGTLSNAITKAKEILTGIVQTAANIVKGSPGGTAIVVLLALFLIFKD